MEYQCILCLKANEKTFEEAREGKIKVMCQKYIGNIEPCEEYKQKTAKQENRLQLQEAK